jgi:regulator of protease activity HflC (stomatin/prohibitin superfamily)
MIYLAIIVGIVALIIQGVKFGLPSNERTHANFATLGGLLLAGVLTIVASIATISPGHRGVQIIFSELTPLVLQEGWHMVNPFSTVHEISVRVEKDQETYTAETADTQSVQITIITNWKPDPDKMSTLFHTHGLNYAEKIIPPAIRECVKAEVSKHKVTDLIAKRPIIHDAINKTINEWLNKYHLQVLEVGVAEINFSDTYDHAIEAKQVQEQQALQKQYELQKTETEARMAEARARGEAQSRIEAARGDAESITISAKAEAEALRLKGEAQADFYKKVSDSLTPMMLQGEYLKKWDGKLPVYVLGSDSNQMISLPPIK